jgi:hypothetical protein
MSGPAVTSRRMVPEELVRLTAEQLQLHVERHVADCARYIEASMPELREGELARGLLESAGDNFRVLFAALRDGTPVAETKAPRGAIAYADIMVRLGIPLATLLRAYRFGISFLWELWRDALAEHPVAPETQVAALDQAMHVVFDYVDHVCDEVTEAYAVARERWNRGAAALRAETVESLLAGGPVDADAAATRLGYDLRRHHVAFVLSVAPGAEGEDVLRRLETAGQWLGGALGCGRPLLVPQGMTALWVWAGSADPPDDGALEDLCRRHPELRGIAVACGEPCADVDGFRRTHEQARRAAAVAAMSERAAGRLTRYAKVVVPSLMLGDVEAARDFVLAELGGLAAQDDATSRVRATVQVFLEEGARTSTTARRLAIHQNTVAYRLHQAEAIIGRPVAERRFELEAALRLYGLLA